MPRISRRTAGKLLLAAPVAPLAIARGDTQEAPKPSPFAACIAASDSTLSDDERARLQKGIAGVEQSLATIRSFTVPPGTEPAFRFIPMQSRRRG